MTREHGQDVRAAEGHGQDARASKAGKMPAPPGDTAPTAFQIIRQLIGQVLYLEAEAAGLRATGIGAYFDELVHELAGFEGRRFQSLYHFTVGAPVENPRITTLPSYPCCGFMPSGCMFSVRLKAKDFGF